MESKAIIKRENKIEFTPEQVALVKSQIAKDANNDELQLFLYQCKRTGLDPMTRQIYFMKRAGKMTIQTSIDGFRVIAERSGDYAGQDEPVFEEDNGKLIKATVKVYRWRGEQRYCAAVGVAYMNEYYPQAGQDFMWKKMPHTMLAKVAEALALRKAYPQDLSGLYTTEEMQQTEEIRPYVKSDIESGYVTEEAQHEMIIPIGDIERDELFALLASSTYEQKVRDKLFSKINSLYTREDYEKAKQNLLANQLGIDGAVNPSQKEINKHINKLSKVPA
jgi:phage recombination protein Bet